MANKKSLKCDHYKENFINVLRTIQYNFIQKPGFELLDLVECPFTLHLSSPKQVSELGDGEGEISESGRRVSLGNSFLPSDPKGENDREPVILCDQPNCVVWTILTKYKERIYL